MENKSLDELFEKLSNAASDEERDAVLAGMWVDACGKTPLSSEDMARVAGGVITNEAVNLTIKFVMVAKLAGQNKVTCKAGIERTFRNQFPNGYHGTTLQEFYRLVDQLWDQY